MRRTILAAAALAALVSSCATDEFQQTKAQVAQSIAAEQPGGYYIGRRFYRREFFFLGALVRAPPHPRAARLSKFDQPNGFLAAATRHTPPSGRSRHCSLD